MPGIRKNLGHFYVVLQKFSRNWISQIFLRLWALQIYTFVGGYRIG
jgi:hypothetical protein